MVFCVVVVFFLVFPLYYHRVVYFAVKLFLDSGIFLIGQRAAFHPPMIDVCTRVCIMRWSFLPFWDVFSSLNFSMLSVFRSTPSSPVWLFYFFLHVGCRAMHSEGTLIRSHLYKSPFQVSPHSHVQESTIFCVYVGSAFAKLNFWMSLKVYTTPRWLSWVGGAVDTGWVPSLELSADGEYRNTSPPASGSTLGWIL